MQLPSGPLLVPSLAPLLSHLASAVGKKEIPYYKRKPLTIKRNCLTTENISLSSPCGWQHDAGSRMHFPYFQAHNDAEAFNMGSKEGKHRSVLPKPFRPSWSR